MDNFFSVARWSLPGLCYLGFVVLMVSTAVAQGSEKKPIIKAYDGQWHVTYETLCSGDIKFIATIKEGQITGRMMSNGTSGEFEVTGEMDTDGTYAVELDGGDYMGESDGALGDTTGHGEYTAPPKSSFTGCDGTWTWRRKK